MKIKSRPTDDRHKALADKLCQFLKDEAGDLPDIELLALNAQVLGMIIAYQDQYRYTPDEIMTIVRRNMEAGNRRVIEGLANSPAGGTA